MRVSRIAIYALLLLVLVAGIGGWQYRQKYIYRQLEKIEELLQHQADSAWQILTKMEHPDGCMGEIVHSILCSIRRLVIKTIYRWREIH